MYACNGPGLCKLFAEALHACCSAAVKFRAEEAVTNFALSNYSQELEHFDEVGLLLLPSRMRVHGVSAIVYSMHPACTAASIRAPLGRSDGHLYWKSSGQVLLLS